MFHFSELTSIDDPFLPAWLDLYETAFIPGERMLISTYLRLLKNRDDPESLRHHILAVVEPCSESVETLAGIVHYRTSEELRLATLWYLAIQPGLRGQGLGAQVYQAILERLDPNDFDLLLFEVEIPEIQPDGEHRRIAQRRIGFYQRQGAQLLGGIDYLQVVGPHQPGIPMHLMAHLLTDLSPQAVFERAKAVFGDCLSQTGELSLQPS